MNTPPNKDALLAEIERRWNAFQEYLKTLTDEQITGLTDAAGWTIKDHLTHLAAWEDGVYGLLTGRPRREQMDIDERTWQETWDTRDFDRINALIRQRHQHRPPAEVLAMFQDVHRRLIGKIQSMSDEDLQRPYRHFEPDSDSETPITVVITLNTSGHYDEHLPWIQAIAAR